MMDFQKPKFDENDLFFVLNGPGAFENVEWEPEPISKVLDPLEPSSIFSLFEKVQGARKQEEEEEEMKEALSKDQKGNPSSGREQSIFGSIEVQTDVKMDEITNKEIILVTAQGTYAGYVYLINLFKLAGNKGDFLLWNFVDLLN